MRGSLLFIYKVMKIVVGITGASGSIYAERLIGYLEQSPEVEQVAVVLSDNAKKIYEQETGGAVSESSKVRLFDDANFYTPFASGSSSYDCMVIAPCSAGTLGRIAGGVSNSLITRAADVMLKERRPLVLVMRETPYSLIHIRNMETVTLSGAIVCPACPSYYSAPKSIEELADTVVFRVLSLLKIPNNGYKWMEN